MTSTPGMAVGRRGILVLPLGEQLREKPAAMLLVFFFLIGLLVVSLYMFVIDWLTSVYGYQRLGTQTVSALEPYIVGALPQLVQIAFGFMALERRNWLFGGIAITAFMLDATTDFAYRTENAASTMVFVAAFFQSVLLFTLASEFLLIASLENLVEYYPSVMEALAITANRIVSSSAKVSDTFQDDIDQQYPIAQPRPPGRKQPPNHPTP